MSVFIVAELSANHNHSLDLAKRTIEAAAKAGADAIKIQTYTADTLTIDCDAEPFRIHGGLWDGETLYNLYRKAYTPWEWHAELQRVAQDCGLMFFSTPFDATAVDFLESLRVPVHKIASFELVDIPLLRKVGATGKPVILSTGMATAEEIQEALDTLRNAGCPKVTLLKCVSQYPANPAQMNLATIPDMRTRFGVDVGLSDHTLGSVSAVAAVALGATMVEKHFILDRSNGGPDAGFSSEPSEFKAMVEAIRVVELAVGKPHYGVSEGESTVFRRSLFAVRDIWAGEPVTSENVRSIRPGCGLPPRCLDALLGRKALRDIPFGTPLKLEYFEGC